MDNLVKKYNINDNELNYLKLKELIELYKKYSYVNRFRDKILIFVSVKPCALHK